MQQQAGRTLPELEQEPFPLDMEYLWSTFLELSMTRQEAGPITFREIRAYSDLMNMDIQSREVQTIRKLDITWLRSRRDSDG